MKYSLIVAHDLKRGIGKNGTIPWDLASDRKRFKTTTLGSAVVMGRKTWESLPVKPLPDRVNIVLSHSPVPYPSSLDSPMHSVCLTYSTTSKPHVVDSYSGLDTSLEELKVEEVFFIGGTSIYEEALKRYKISEIHITEIFSDFSCDTFFPKLSIDTRFITESEIYNDNGLTYRYYVYRPNLFRVDDEEFYLMMLNETLRIGKHHADRTGVGTLAMFGENYLSFDLKDGFPLLTTKKVYWKGVACELLFFLRGDTNNKHLVENKVNIWTPNSSREALDRIGLENRAEGDLGPVYGWQWRHMGADYVDCETDYSGKGYDQLAEIVHDLKHNKGSRRIIMTAWNPNDLKQMCLPPCHVLYQFNVEYDELSCCMYQRSADLFLGVPFNIASTALLTHLLAKTCDLIPARITIYYGNAHVYVNHIDQVKEQLERKPYPFPKLEIREKKAIDEYTFEDLVLTNYKHHPEIKAPMAV